jgi:hypothetical protein
MEVLIVAKTYMRSAYCVGAYDLTNKANIRLLTSNEENQPIDSKFEIGQIWNIEYIPRSNKVLPHFEDVLIQKASYIKMQTRLNEYLINKMSIWKGNPDNIFNGKIKFPCGQSGFLEQKNSDLKQSVGFWLPDQDLELTILDDNKHYYYFGEEQVFAFPYVGTKKVIEKIRKGTLIRVSLARWWSPNISRQEKRCYCQLSGWYED